jgi:hypothetical protein
MAIKEELTLEQAKDLEIGIYNWSIQFSDKNKIIKKHVNKFYKEKIQNNK